MSNRTQRLFVLAPRLLLIVGVALSGYALISFYSARAYNQRQLERLDRIIDRAEATGTGGSAMLFVEPGMIGRIDIERLGIAAIIMESDDSSTLDGAVGHIPGTALPGDIGGNVGLAAHRDGLFHELRNVTPGDSIRVETPWGKYEYVVSATEIVDPDDTWVLDEAPGRDLTLITCYPFGYFGPAPHRFVVHATIMGSSGRRP